MIGKVQNGFVSALSIAIGLVACSGGDSESKTDSMTNGMYKAVATLKATTGNTANGTVTFAVEEGGVRVVAHLEGMPEGDHGFHIHEFGDCSSGDGKSAGGHFNPEGMPHAGPSAEKRHVGDLGNISANASGVAHAEFVDKHLTFEGVNSIIGKGVILHAGADDLTSQPTGAAGARLACGVIEKS